jgi:glycosyltransferase involved in cell wall biosynthesis
MANKIMNPLVSIIIPCYNDAQYIEQSVHSALNQTYPFKEIIIVDDGSNAETKEVLKKLEPQVTKLITQENKGQSTARNVGIREARGEYVLVLDSDDFFESTFCEKAVKAFLQNNYIKIVTCYSNLLFEDGSSCIYRHRGGAINKFLYSNNALGSALFKKKDWDYCGGYDESMINGFEDWEFYIRLLKKEGIAEVIKEPLYNYRKRGNTTTSRANKGKYDLLKYIYIKHQELYVDNFNLFVDHLLNKIEREEKEKIKNTQRLEFKIGRVVLFPFRWIKSLSR